MEHASSNEANMEGQALSNKEETKRKFSEPELQIYDSFVNITLFSSTTNVTGGTFF